MHARIRVGIEIAPCILWNKVRTERGTIGFGYTVWPHTHPVSYFKAKNIYI
jgi:hypothetical protein